LDLIKLGDSNTIFIFVPNQDHQRAIDNFYKVIKPGGIMILDHRNYDFILDHGFTSQKNIYYNVITYLLIAI
jgi:hypothetical protein